MQQSAFLIPAYYMYCISPILLQRRICDVVRLYIVMRSPIFPFVADEDSFAKSAVDYCPEFYTRKMSPRRDVPCSSPDSQQSQFDVSFFFD